MMGVIKAEVENCIYFWCYIVNQTNKSSVEEKLAKFSCFPFVHFSYVTSLSDKLPGCVGYEVAKLFCSCCFSQTNKVYLVKLEARHHTNTQVCQWWPLLMMFIINHLIKGHIFPEKGISFRERHVTVMKYILCMLITPTMSSMSFHTFDERMGWGVTDKTCNGNLEGETIVLKTIVEGAPSL